MAETECMGQGLPGDEAGQGFTQHTACICSMYCIFSMMQVLWVSKVEARLVQQAPLQPWS